MAVKMGKVSVYGEVYQWPHAIQSRKSEDFKGLLKTHLFMVAEMVEDKHLRLQCMVYKFN